LYNTPSIEKLCVYAYLQYSSFITAKLGLIHEMAGIKRIFTFFGDMNDPEKLESFTVGSELAEQVERLYKLKEKYSQERYG